MILVLRPLNRCFPCGGRFLANIAIIGPGAIGQWLGAKLDLAGHAVMLVGRDGPRTGNFSISGLTTHTWNSRELSSVDQAWICTKSYDTKAAAQTAAELGAGQVISLQNGVGNAEIVAAEVDCAVGVALTSHGITRAEGVVHRGLGMMAIGSFRGDCQPALAALLETDLQPRWSDDVVGEIWGKAAINAAINPVAAVHDCSNGQVLANYHAKSVELAGEVHALSRAAGIPLPYDVVAMTTLTLEKTAENYCSMVQDLRAGRLTEIEQINGYFIRVARRLGYPATANEAIYRNLKHQEAQVVGEAASLAATKSAAEAFRFEL